MKRTPAAVALAALLAACQPSPPAALQGYVEGEFVRVAAPFAGTLVTLDVQRGQAITVGQSLFALEAENEQAVRREAQEQVSRAQAQVEDLRKGRRPTEIEAVRAQLQQAEAVATLSAKDLVRQQDLATKGFVSTARVDEAKAAANRDLNRVRELQNDLATARAGARPDEIRAAEAQARAARESLAQADWRLRQKSVASNVAGVVTDTLFVRGEWVPAGTPVVTILPPANVKARFFVPEGQVGALKLGQAVELRCDGCGEAIAASISFIAPQAEYTPPVIYSKENRTKLVFLVEARPSAADAVRLHPGQPVDVTIK
jgi:HlyD family secretion protein